MNGTPPRPNAPKDDLDSSGQIGHNDSAPEPEPRICHLLTSPAGGMMSHMADSGAVRQARHKAHKAGDHSGCRHPVGPRPVVVPLADRGDGRDLDPVGELRALAAGLMAAWRADPGNAVLAREARATLLCIPAEEPDDVLAELRAMVDACR